VSDEETPAGEETDKAAGKTIEERIEALKFGADDGHAESMFLLGVAYAQGAGVERDEKLAAKWFHESSKRGFARAKTSLAFLTATGRGVRRDPVRAYVLLAEAAAAGDTEASDMQFRLRKKMHPAEIKEAEKRVEKNASVA
jgi:TPR repeat protein